MSDKYLPDTFFQLLNPDNTSSYNRYIAHAIGATETIIYFSLISKMTYYFKNGMLDDEGFFYATAIDIQESTTFTTRQQAPAIDKLVKIGLIQTKYAGIPAKKYFRIINNQELVISLLEQGEEIANNLRQKKCKRSNNQLRQNVETCVDKMSKLEITKCRSKEEQNVETCIDKMSNKTKVSDLLPHLKRWGLPLAQT